MKEEVPSKCGRFTKIILKSHLKASQAFRNKKNEIKDAANDEGVQFVVLTFRELDHKRFRIVDSKTMLDGRR